MQERESSLVESIVRVPHMGNRLFKVQKQEGDLLSGPGVGTPVYYNGIHRDEVVVVEQGRPN